jgi:hypothetical protein
MKRTLLIVLSLLIVQVSAGQIKKTMLTLTPPAVDQRVELVSIAARLAGYQEYSSERYRAYALDIHAYFDKYQQHPLISYMREIRHSHSMSYDAVMAMAVHLSPVPDLIPVVEFNRIAPEPRWGKPAALRFATLLQQFYKDTKAEAFFTNQQSRYHQASLHLSKAIQPLDVSWFYRFYGGAPKSSFNVVIGLGNGGANYASTVVDPNGTTFQYAILGTWKFDQQGEPVYNSSVYLPGLIHEFNHAFVNELTTRYESQLHIAGQILYQSDTIKMQEQGYGDWKVMLNEALVKAAVIRYQMQHQTTPAVVNREIETQVSKGFVWIKALTALLATYEKNRQRYPTLESFMPQLVKFYNITATRINAPTDPTSNSNTKKEGDHYP